MRAIIQKLSRLKLVGIITLAALIMAVITDLLLAWVLDHVIGVEDLIRAAIIPLFIAPFVSWYLVGLIFRLDRTERKMTELATQDSLTGLLNRRAFYDTYHYASVNTRPYLAFLLFDLDFFKRINDVYGHVAGDALLFEFAHTLQKTLPSETIIARMGGEEFAAVTPVESVEVLERLANEVLSSVRELEVIHDGNIMRVTVSIGISLVETKIVDNLEIAYKQADTALYEAKRAGRDQYSFNIVR